MPLKPNFTGHRKDTEMLENYFELFKYMKWPRKILEIGIDQGGSLKLLNDLFNPELLMGLDNATENKVWDGYPIMTFYYDQKDDDSFYTSQVFDLIIDDASHVKELTLKSLYKFWPNLSDRGIYIIEDYRHYEMEDLSDVMPKIAENLNSEYKQLSHLLALKK